MGVVNEVPRISQEDLAHMIKNMPWSIRILLGILLAANAVIWGMVAILGAGGRG